MAVLEFRGRVADDIVSDIDFPDPFRGGIVREPVGIPDLEAMAGDVLEGASTLESRRCLVRSILNKRCLKAI